MNEGYIHRMDMSRWMLVMRKKFNMVTNHMFHTCGKLFYSNISSYNIGWNKRIIHKARNTGMKELDIILPNFIKQRLDKIDFKEFNELLELDTPTLYNTIIVNRTLPTHMNNNSAGIALIDFINKQENMSFKDETKDD